MGYWGNHPMAGDAPLDAISILECYAFEEAGINRDEDVDATEIKNAIENVKYNLIDEGTELLIEEDKYFEDFSFVIPFIFLNYDIRFPKDKIDTLINLLGDGGASRRGYDEDSEGPMETVLVIRKYKEYLFDEEKTVDDAIENIPKEDLAKLFDKGLLATIIEHKDSGEDGLVNVK